MKTAFNLISTISQKNNVCCVLIGGFAINYYNVTRQTADIDFLITETDYQKILPYLIKAGYNQDNIQKVFVRLKSEKYIFDIDFMFVDKDTLDKIINEGRKICLAGEEFIIPSLYNLLALKMHSIKYNPFFRENKDLPDIINLIRINKVNYKSNKFKQLCLKYGTREIYLKILERIK
jgi:hypothetical protein